jgi:hypothetical protein
LSDFRSSARRAIYQTNGAKPAFSGLFPILLETSLATLCYLCAGYKCIIHIHRTCAMRKPDCKLVWRERPLLNPTCASKSFCSPRYHINSIRVGSNGQSADARVHNSASNPHETSAYHRARMTAQTGTTRSNYNSPRSLSSSSFYRTRQALARSVSPASLPSTPPTQHATLPRPQRPSMSTSTLRIYSNAATIRLMALAAHPK